MDDGTWLNMEEEENLKGAEQSLGSLKEDFDPSRALSIVIAHNM